MEPVSAYWGSIVFTAIVVVLGVLYSFLGRTRPVEQPSATVIDQSATPTPVQQTSITSPTRRKNARKRERRRAKNKQTSDDQQPTQQDIDDEPNPSVQSMSTTNDAEDEEEEEEQQHEDDDEQFEDAILFKEPSPRPLIRVEDEQKPAVAPPPKVRQKPKPSPPEDESSHPSKPHACVAPVKQTSSTHSTDHPSPRLRPPIDPIGSKRESNGKSSIPLDSAARPNDFIPSPQQQHASNTNGYSSESDLRSDTTTSTSSPTEYLSALKGLAAHRSAPRVRVDQLLSVFETNSFTSDELQLLLNKATSKHPFNRPDWQRFSSPTKNNHEKIIERLIDENNRHQLKLLAIELQTEQARARELAKTNAELDQTMRQLQQQQQQQPSPGVIQFQQTVHSYQIQSKRLAEENSQLVHQLNACGMMPNTLNDLKQQQQVLLEQIRQMELKNATLDQEISDGERASKNAAEIYKKADAQKQDRIEQMVADLNRYKKIDKDLAALRQKHHELEKNSPAKLKELTHQRDELDKLCEELKSQVEQYDQLKDHSSNSLEHDLREVQDKHDILQQRNYKLIEQLKKLTQERIPSS